MLIVYSDRGPATLHVLFYICQRYNIMIVERILIAVKIALIKGSKLKLNAITLVIGDKFKGKHVKIGFF